MGDIVSYLIYAIVLNSLRIAKHADNHSHQTYLFQNRTHTSVKSLKSVFNLLSKNLKISLQRSIEFLLCLQRTPTKAITLTHASTWTHSHPTPRGRSSDGLHSTLSASTRRDFGLGALDFWTDSHLLWLHLWTWLVFSCPDGADHKQKKQCRLTARKALGR